MKPRHFEGVNMVLGAPINWDAERRGPCSKLSVMRQDGVSISLWGFTPRERLSVLLGRDVYVHVSNGHGHPPISLTLKEPAPWAGRPEKLVGRGRWFWWRLRNGAYRGLLGRWTTWPRDTGPGEGAAHTEASGRKPGRTPPGRREGGPWAVRTYRSLLGDGSG